MSLINTNNTFYRVNPSSSSLSFSHNNPPGDDTYLVMVVTMQNTVNFSTMRYNGVNMTLKRNQNFSGLSQRQGTYFIPSPSDGNNTVSVNFSASQFNPVSVAVMSFTGCIGLGNDIVGGGSNTSRSVDIDISQNSMIYVTGISTSNQEDYIIDGITTSNLFTHNINKLVEGNLSTNLNSGTITTTTITTNNTISNYSVEILENEPSPPTGLSEGNWLPLL